MFVFELQMKVKMFFNFFSRWVSDEFDSEEGLGAVPFFSTDVLHCLHVIALVCEMKTNSFASYSVFSPAIIVIIMILQLS